MDMVIQRVIIKLEFDVYSPLVGYTIYQDGFPVGSSDDNEWSTVIIYWFDN